MDRSDRKQKLVVGETAILHKGFENECEVRLLVIRRRTAIVRMGGFTVIVPKKSISSKIDSIIEKQTNG